MASPPFGGGAAAATAFSAPIRRLMVPTAATAVLAACGSGTLLASLPFLMVSSRMVRSEGPDESPLQFGTKMVIFHLFYGGLLLLGSWVVLLPFCGTASSGWHALSLYLPSYVIVTHDRSEQYSPCGTLVLRIFFDAPLVSAAYVCRELFGARLFSPFCTILDDAVVQGSLPLPSDIATLAGEPYNVGLVVNMCREYAGATGEMARLGVRQLRLPHIDTTAPSYESVVRGCDVIREFRRDNPSKRVYVHCKGGIARASTMTLAHYVRNEGREAAVAIEEMKRKRHVVYVTVKDYPAIVRLEKERLEREKEQVQMKLREST